MDPTEVIKTAGRYDAASFITILIIVCVALGFAAWFRYVYIPSEESRRKANELTSLSNDLMGKTLSAVSGLLTQTHEKVVNSHDKIDLIEQRLQMIMATKRIEAEIFTVLSDRAGIDIKPQLGQMRGILDDSRWWDRMPEQRRN